MRCGILTMDRRGNLLMVNEHARQILEMAELLPAGLPVEAALADYPQLAQILRESFSMSSLPNRAEIDLRCRSDKGKTIGFTLSLVSNDDGVPVGAAIFFKDLTHVEHREEQERLRDRLAALGQMAANLAHEIRKPLASIEVNGSLLRRRLGTESGHSELIDKMMGEIRRLNATITSSLEYVRPERVSLVPVSIDAVLDNALEVARGHAGPGIRVEQQRTAGVPTLLADPDRLRQVFENVMLNAIESMADEGVLRIETALVKAPAATSTPYRPKGAKTDPFASFSHYLVVRIADSGAGVKSEHLDKLFNPFFTTKPQGSGVGLATARKIVDAHRGLIDVRNRRNGGAEFTVRLPLVQPEA